jgi:hypothetical protein
MPLRPILQGVMFFIAGLTPQLLAATLFPFVCLYVLLGVAWFRPGQALVALGTE